jgi:ligand-binding sensor domain-containing protein
MNSCLGVGKLCNPHFEASRMKKVAAIFFIWSSVITGYAQVPFFQHYFLLKKNDPVQVNTIYQARNGILWLGTNKGLFEFDGVNHRRFTKAENLPDDHVTSIGQDSLGRIWTGHKNGELAFLENGKITKFNTLEGATTAEISDILFDKRGILWFSTMNDGLYYLMNDRLYRLDENEGMPDLFVYDIAEDAQGNIWAGTDGGTAICTWAGNKVEIKVLNNSSGSPDNIIKKIKMSEDGTVWMATEDAGIILFDPKSEEFQPMLSEDWKYGTVSDFLVDKKQVWFASHEAGIAVYNRETKHFKVYNPTNEGAYTSVQTLLKDFEGNLWAGLKSGLMRGHGDELEFIHQLNTSKNNVLAVATDKEGQIWFANGEGLFIYKKDANGIAHSEQQLVNTPYQKGVIISLYIDDKGYIWAGLYGEGALRINPLNGKVKFISRELRNGNILNITGRGDVVWLATLGGGSKIKFKGDELIVENYGSEEGLISDYIYQVFIDTKDRVWFATDGKGIDMLDEKGFHHYQEGLPSKVIYGFAEDKNGKIWANVQANGLYQFNGTNFKPFPSGIRLRDNNVNGLASDKWGNLVAMHDLGIDVFDPSENKLRYLGDEAGIHDQKPNLNAVAKDQSGRIYFGTESGIVSYSNINTEAFASPKVILRELKIFDQKISFSPDLKLMHDENNVTVGYQGIWYQNAQNLNYRFRLENYDLDWIDSRNHSVTYSRLPPGIYTFHLQASETDNFSHAEEATFQFLIHPPFWRTIPFYIISVITVFILGYSFLAYRERRLRKDKLILEAKVESRTEQIKKKNQEIQAQNDEILTQNEEIQAQAEEIKGINENLEHLVQERTKEVLKKSKALEEYAFINAHKLRSPVASVLGLINLLDKTELNPEAQAIHEHLKRSAGELDAIVYSITKAIEKGIDDKPL